MAADQRRRPPGAPAPGPLPGAVGQRRAPGRAGPPEWKDTVELRDAQTVEIVTRFTGYRGRYVLHCHNLEHEDMAMMAAFEVV
ncbi:multicopper oxidase domain-containing protein [Nonomuraea sp. M3C6]|uniref:Multicopper oxidase domain-containing protein n=1 Tax=Nonomuraea marmarensis TaxID=3351344 RepID=A0ABW7APN4_9ACTN